MDYNSINLRELTVFDLCSDENIWKDTIRGVKKGI